MELRYLIRNGEKILQYRTSYTRYTTSGVIGLPVEVFCKWQDVEIVIIGDYDENSTEYPTEETNILVQEAKET